MVKFTSTNNPKVIKKVLQTSSKRYLSLSSDFKAEQFIRLNILPLIISTQLFVESADQLQKFVELQKFAKIRYKVSESQLPYLKIKSFMEDFLVYYNNFCNTVKIGVTKKITIQLLNEFLEIRRTTKSKYIPNIFSTKATNFDRENDLTTYSAREMLAEYLNIIYFEDYNKLYRINFSDDYGYHILANCALRTKSLILPGLTARISKPRQCEDNRSMILIQRKGTSFMVLDH